MEANKRIHGGDIYSNKIDLDFSVNINPFGIPDGVKKAMHEAIDSCDRYPDIFGSELRNSIAKHLSNEAFTLTPENILLGNGASELFMAVVHAIKPRRSVLMAPSFYGYEYALSAVDCDISYCNAEFDNMDLLKMLGADIDIVFLANPNNPTGSLHKINEIIDLLKLCKAYGIYVVIDECFIDFCEEPDSVIDLIYKYDNMIVVRAFTKIFAIPGVRLGYIAAGSDVLIDSIKRQLPEWNVSVIAQQAGMACLKETDYVKKTASYVSKQRQFLTKGLQQLGFKVIESRANFILFYSDVPLYGLLLDRGILIRDCSNYRGLTQGYYRIAVKTQEQNEVLLKAAGDCIEEYRTFTANGN